MKRVYLSPLLFIGSFVYAMEDSKIVCVANGPSRDIAAAKSFSCKYLVEGSIDLAKSALQSLSSEHKSSPVIKRKLIAAAASNPKTINKSLELLEMNGISLASLNESDRDAFLKEALNEFRNDGACERLATFLRNYEQNEPNKDKARAVIKEIIIQLNDMLITEESSQAFLTTFLNMPCEIMQKTNHFSEKVNDIYVNATPETIANANDVINTMESYATPYSFSIPTSPFNLLEPMDFGYSSN